VGDVHEAWDERDEAALRSLEGDMVVFVGDFGNEAVQLVSQVSVQTSRRTVRTQVTVAV
jgi:hypothetical protein